jgi:hypothetical protein
MKFYEYGYDVNKFGEIRSALQKKGLNPCPQLTAPELAILNADIVKEGQYVDIISEPITVRGGYQDRDLFVLSRIGGKLVLRSYWKDRIRASGRLIVGCLPPETERKIEVWKTVEVGGKTVQALEEELKHPSNDEE